MPNNIHTTNGFIVQMAIDQRPELEVDKFLDIVKYGKDNNYPDKLIYWIDNDAEHGRICSVKADYLTGSNISSENETPQAEAWLSKANPKESWQQLRTKYNYDKVVSGGYYLKIISNIAGIPIEFYHMEFAKCRLSPCHKWVIFSEDWKNPREEKFYFPVWTDGKVGVSVFIYKRYSPSASKLESTYPKPEYISCTLDIDTDARISTFGNSLVRKGFTAGHVVDIFNGESDPTKQEDIAERIKGNHGGEDNAGNTVVIFADPNGKPTNINTVGVSDLDKQYEVISKRCQQKKLTGHNVSGVLFKIKTEGQLGNRTELIEAHELFINEYVIINQDIELRTIKHFYKLRFNQDENFKIEQVKRIGYDWTSPGIIDKIPISYINEKLGIENKAVVVKNSSQDKNVKFFELFDKYAHDIEEDEVIDVQLVSFKSVRDVVKFEINIKDDKELQNNVLNQIKGNPSATQEQIAKSINIEESKVAAVIAFLVTAGLIKIAGDIFEVTEKGMKIDSASGSEVYTEYVYAKRSDVDGPAILPTTRDFCRLMYEKTRRKALSFESIIKMENEFGENVWDFRGGFYNNGIETTPFCRHVWSAVTKIKRR